MTTYLLLALHDDGRSDLHDMAQFPNCASHVSGCVMPLQPVASGNDRGPYRTYEVAGFSIDVAQSPVESPEAKAVLAQAAEYLMRAGTEAMKK